ncbi:MAG: AsmA family protein [Pseudomonadota bacterium]|nr:AsmA family protein [Pseudomonadota bacterium]
MGVVKKILIAVFGIAIVTVIAVAVIIATIDPNDYREDITQMVKKQTGRDFTFDSIELSLYPNIGADIQNAKLSNASGFAEKDFMKVEQISINVAILPLISQQLEIDTLTLHGLNINLAKNAEGVTNWDDLIQANNKPEKSTHDRSKTHSLDQLESLNFGGLDIRNGQVHWDDQQAQQKVNLTDFNLVTSAITFGEFFNIDLNANTTVSQPELSSQLTLNIDVKVDKNGQFEVKNLTQTNQLQGKVIPVEQVITELSIPTINLDLDKQLIALPDITVNYSVKGGQGFPAKQVEGVIKVTQLSANLEQQVVSSNAVNVNYELQGGETLPITTAMGSVKLENPSFALTRQTLSTGLLTLKSDLTGETLPNGKATIHVTAVPALDLTKDTASLTKLVIKAVDVQTDGAVHVTKLTNEPNVTANLNVKQFNLRALLKQLKLDIPALNTMSDTKTLTKVAAKADVTFNSKNQAVNAKNIVLTLDDSKLKGNASVKNFDKPNIGYNLDLDKINVSRYLPPPAPTQKPVKEEPATDIEIPLPTELLRSLTLNGTFKAGSVQYDKLNPTNIVVTTKGANGLININPLKMNIFKTKVDATAKLDVRGKQPKYAVTLNTKKLPVGDVLIAFTDNDQISGLGTVKANLTTSGDKLSLIKQGLNGTLYANLINGAVKGFNLAQSIREAKAKISGTKSTANTEELQTDFSSLVGNFTIKNGIVNTNKLEALAPFMRIDGSGTIDLPKEKLDYLVKTKIVGSDKGQGGKELQELSGLTIPVKLKGNWSSPDISLDLKSLLGEKAKLEAKKKLDKKKEEVTKKLEEELKSKLLKGLPF